MGYEVDLVDYDLEVLPSPEQIVSSWQNATAAGGWKRVEGTVILTPVSPTRVSVLFGPLPDQPTEAMIRASISPRPNEEGCASKEPLQVTVDGVRPASGERDQDKGLYEVSLDIEMCPEGAASLSKVAAPTATNTRETLRIELAGLPVRSEDGVSSLVLGSEYRLDVRREADPTLKTAKVVQLRERSSPQEGFDGQGSVHVRTLSSSAVKKIEKLEELEVIGGWCGDRASGVEQVSAGFGNFVLKGRTGDNWAFDIVLQRAPSLRGVRRCTLEVQGTLDVQVQRSRAKRFERSFEVVVEFPPVEAPRSPAVGGVGQ